MTAARLAAVRAVLGRWEAVRPAPSAAIVAGLRAWADSIEQRLDDWADQGPAWGRIERSRALSDLAALERAVGITTTEESTDDD